MSERRVEGPCPVCGDPHDYTPKECGNFLTFGQGGADFAESQRIARVFEEEGRDIIPLQDHEQVNR